MVLQRAPFRKNFDAVVDVDGKVGGQYTVIQDADDDLDSGNYTLLVKTGTYAAGFNVTTNNAYIFVEPGTVIQSAITLSGTGVTLVLGAQCDVQGYIELSGANCSLLCLGGCDIDGLIASGADCLIDGGGWDTLSNGGSDRDGVRVSADDCIIQNLSVQTTGGSERGVQAHECSRIVIRNVQVVDSDDIGINFGQAPDGLITGCVILSATGFGINLQNPRTKVQGCTIIGAGGDGINLAAGSDDSVIIGNVVKDQGGDSIDIDDNAENCVIVGNRLDGSITDGTGTATIANNDEATDFGAGYGD